MDRQVYQDADACYYVVEVPLLQFVRFPTEERVGHKVHHEDYRKEHVDSEIPSPFRFTIFKVFGFGLLTIYVSARILSHLLKLNYR